MSGDPKFLDVVMVRPSRRIDGVPKPDEWTDIEFTVGSVDADGNAFLFRSWPNPDHAAEIFHVDRLVVVRSSDPLRAFAHAMCEFHWLMTLEPDRAYRPEPWALRSMLRLAVARPDPRMLREFTKFQVGLMVDAMGPQDLKGCPSRVQHDNGRGGITVTYRASKELLRWVRRRHHRYIEKAMAQLRGYQGMLDDDDHGARWTIHKSHPLPDTLRYFSIKGTL